MNAVLSGSNKPIQEDNIVQAPGILKYLHNVLSQEECDKIIAIAEEKGFVKASLVTDKNGVEHYSNIRKSERCIIDSEPFAQALWNRILPYIPDLEGFEKNCINERLRILKYNVGDEFKHHTDGTYVDAAAGTQSKITILIYLNQDYSGAYTSIYCQENLDIQILPNTGSLLLQDQALLHHVPVLREGTKYVIRTEIMYKQNTNLNGIKVIKIN